MTFKPKSSGTNADLAAGVNIEKVHGNYFSSIEAINSFISMGIGKIEHLLSKEVIYIDFGGGTGTLTKEIVKYLESKGFKVNSKIIDANKNYLIEADKKGIKTKLANLQEFQNDKADLITMRAVLHYNPIDIQQNIIRKCLSCLNDKGFLITQISSGNKANCELRTEIVNLRSLGRANKNEEYRWITERKYISMCKKAGFEETILAGYAPECKWGPEEQWDRFNKIQTEKAIKENNLEELELINKRKKDYLSEANELIERYIKKYGSKEVGIEKTKDSFVIHYKYPILISNNGCSSAKR